MSVSAILLAAGAGTRMRSERPKPLHRICGRPMVLHVIHALHQLHPARTVVVVGHGAEQVTKCVQVLLADEAFGHLDEVTAAELRETFLDLARECGSTAVLIS